ncbi:DUF1329 domain-containing protein [Burkholderia sp. Bp9143]|uniref:DUF1329 domain-containing protein n=1 Tax=Burkholderia sp. Bp9143 TaxID=2184574 RepID=UPI000F5B5FA4|nr:DUF1329 domain-containing protein [Burkholderia sp. Bp9143]RQR22051.1 DUF1329 domain-containing protein [Burkholderia sp. Bp9143]
MFNKIILLAGSMQICHTALAAVTAEEAKQLGGDKLTAFGAEKAGNKEGTIPPYTGTGVHAPASYDWKDPGQRPSPYDDKRLYTITAQNYTQYTDKLDGLTELFNRYPAFQMQVYPSHRDIVFPAYVQANSIKNATSCKAVRDELVLGGCYGGVPFAIPKTGNEVEQRSCRWSAARTRQATGTGWRWPRTPSAAARPGPLHAKLLISFAS